MSQNNRTIKSLSLGTKVGYGIAGIGDALIYGTLLVYLMYYLTSVAHVDPGKAGTISSVALFISAVTTFFIGYFSDHSKAKSGRRRPFIKVAMPFMFVSFIALFSEFGLEGNRAVIYYGFFAIIIWVSYCTFFVPYTALGAEITSDYSERISIRSYAGLSVQIGNFCSSVLPLMVVGAFAAAGLSESGSWTAMAAVFAVVSIAAIGSMVRATKGKELLVRHEEKETRQNPFKDYFEVIRSKPMKFLIAAILCFAVINSIFSGTLTFFIIYNLGLSEGYVSTIFAITFLVAIPMTPVINLVAQKLDKRKAFIVFFCISALIMIALRIVGVSSIFVLGILAVGFAIANASYWQLISATLYDVAEVIELTTGKRLEGILSSLQSITQQIGSSVATLIMGWILEFNGFDGSAAAQTPQALDAITMLQTILPSVGLLLAALTLVFFPVNKKSYGLIQNALSEKKETGEYSREGLERIV